MAVVGSGGNHFKALIYIFTSQKIVFLRSKHNLEGSKRSSTSLDFVLSDMRDVFQVMLSIIICFVVCVIHR